MIFLIFFWFFFFSFWFCKANFNLEYIYISLNRNSTFFFELFIITSNNLNFKFYFKYIIQFIKKILPYWSIHRHRLAPESYSKLVQLIHSGQVRVFTGTLNQLKVVNNMLKLKIKKNENMNEFLFPFINPLLDVHAISVYPPHILIISPVSLSV